MYKLFSSENQKISSLELSVDEIYATPELAFPTEGVELAGNSRRPYIFFNMVSSVDGKAITVSQNAGGLGSDTDHYMMSRLRAAADAVMTGAETFRRDPFTPTLKPNLVQERLRYFPENPQPLGIVISSQGDLPADKNFWQAGKNLRVLFLGEKASPEREQQWQEFAQVFRVGSDSEGKPDVAQILQILYQDLGVRRLLVEGGPGLNYSFMTKGYADELFWTLAPKVVGGTNGTIVSGALLDLTQLLNLELISMYQNGHELFMRYRFTHTH